MDWLFGWITDWIKQGLIDAITGQFTGIFESVNNQVTDVAAQVGQTPQGWNGGVFSMIQTLSETVVLPIAGMILTFVLVYELIQMILEKNNMHEFDTFNIFKWVFKTFVATYLLTNCFTIVMAVFDVAHLAVCELLCAEAVSRLRDAGGGVAVIAGGLELRDGVFVIGVVVILLRFQRVDAQKLRRAVFILAELCENFGRLVVLSVFDEL